MPDCYACDWQRTAATAVAATAASVSADGRTIAEIGKSADAVRARLGRLDALGRRYLGLFAAAREAGGCLGRRRADLEVILSARRLQSMPAFAQLGGLSVSSEAISVRPNGPLTLAINEEAPAAPQAALAPIVISLPILMSLGEELHAGELVVSLAMRCASDGVWPALWRRPRLRHLSPEMGPLTRAALEHRIWGELDRSFAAAPLFSAADLGAQAGIPGAMSTAVQFRALTDGHVSLLVDLSVPTAQRLNRTQLSAVAGRPTADETLRIRTSTLFDVFEGQAQTAAANKGWTLTPTGRAIVPMTAGLDGRDRSFLRLTGTLTCYDAAFEDTTTMPAMVDVHVLIDQVPSPGRPEIKVPAVVFIALVSGLIPTGPPVTVKILTAGQRAEWSVREDIVDIRVADPSP